ncbi:hypothetical protein MMC21_005263 [Puttea exsequens]|nr:hypothetical protein [Puttea exsequens]
MSNETLPADTNTINKGTFIRHLSVPSYQHQHSNPSEILQTQSKPPNMPTTFLTLPAEIRSQIYHCLLSSQNCLGPPTDLSSNSPATYCFPLSILRVSRLVSHEAYHIFHSSNVFVKITTPWPEAIGHIKREGRVPCVNESAGAAKFEKWHLWVYIDTPIAPPDYNEAGGSMYSMVILLEDLPAFTRMWHFSNLHHQGLNEHLRLKLTIQDPHLAERKIVKGLQQRLLMPFGIVKDLHKFSIEGAKVLPSVVDALAKERVTKDPTMEECIERALSLKELGNQQTKVGQYQDALAQYFAAFDAIHVIVSADGIDRTVHADGFYIREIATGPHQGMRGDYIRMILRVKLVANVMHAYLNLRQPHLAHHWGSRSIRLFRGSVNGSTRTTLDQPGDLDFITQTLATRFPAHEALGKIFYRTAVARREMDHGVVEWNHEAVGGEDGDRAKRWAELSEDGRREALGLMRAATDYLPGDQGVLQELGSLMIEVGARSAA